MPKEKKRNIEELEAELLEIRHRLYEANETIDAIRLGQVDALVVAGDEGDQLYTLKTADQLYRIFIEKMAEGAVTLSAEGIILFSNTQFATMLKLSLPDILGKPFRNFMPAAYEAEFDSIFRESWKADHKQELHLQSKEETVPVQLSLSSLSLENLTVLSIIITDLTQQKATQSQLEQTNRLLEDTNKALENSNHDLQQFASVASHDLQEPLRKMHVLLSYISTRDASTLSDQTSYQITRVMRAAARMRSLVVDVLNYSKLSSNNEVLTIINLDEVVKEVLEDLEYLIREKSAIIELGSLPVLQGNKGQIRQVFQNLIGNALKFSKPGQSPKVQISGTYLPTRSFDSAPSGHGPYTLTRIKDEGIGFNEAYAESIFSLFTRLHSKDQYEGTGIGLAIAKRVVEAHGGLITARSRENMGTEFLILLPVKPPALHG
jgi:PAS domain S-box-containing protein